MPRETRLTAKHPNRALTRMTEQAPNCWIIERLRTPAYHRRYPPERSGRERPLPSAGGPLAMDEVDVQEQVSLRFVTETLERPSEIGSVLSRNGEWVLQGRSVALETLNEAPTGKVRVLTIVTIIGARNWPLYCRDYEDLMTICSWPDGLDLAARRAMEQLRHPAVNGMVAYDDSGAAFDEPLLHMELRLHSKLHALVGDRFQRASHVPEILPDIWVPAVLIGGAFWEGIPAAVRGWRLGLPVG
jgi:hypothetical protein